MSCSIACKVPTPAQAHCGTCHLTFNSVTGFDAHRVAGDCATPAMLGMTLNSRGVYSWPLTEEERGRLSDLGS